MKISVSFGAELNSLLDKLANDIVSARYYSRLLAKLEESISEYLPEFNQARTFWHLTLSALSEARILRLCRVYDGNRKVLSLVNLLDTIAENLNLFGEANFRERVAGNAFVDSLANKNRIPNSAQLEADRELVSNDDPLVKRLTIWRGNVVAHNDTRIALGVSAVLDENPILESIWNSYSIVHSIFITGTQACIERRPFLEISRETTTTLSYSS